MLWKGWKQCLNDCGDGDSVNCRCSGKDGLTDKMIDWFDFVDNVKLMEQPSSVVEFWMIPKTAGALKTIDKLLK